MANYNLKHPSYITLVFHYDVLIDLFIKSTSRYKRAYYKRMAKTHCLKFKKEHFPRKK